VLAEMTGRPSGSSADGYHRLGRGDTLLRPAELGIP
jgi:hypothetical protein